MGAFVVTFIITVLFTFANLFWEAFVASKLWNWFAAAQFSIAQVTFLQTFGLVLLINMLRYKPPAAPTSDSNTVDPEKRPEVARKMLRQAFSAVWTRFGGTLVTLGMAALAHWWMGK